MSDLDLCGRLLARSRKRPHVNADTSEDARPKCQDTPKCQTARQAALLAAAARACSQFTDTSFETPGSCMVTP
jgi:hypothetical protein